MPPVTVEFPYRPRWSTIILSGLFFGMTAVVLGHEAWNNDRGVIINDLIPLGSEGATRFYWALCGFSVLFVLGSLGLAFQRLTFRHRIWLGATSLIAPASRWSHGEIEIPYRDLRHLSVVRVGRQRHLTVVHGSGKITIAATLLPNNEAFDDLRKLIASKIEKE